jgi:hypothetical protein
MDGSRLFALRQRRAYGGVFFVALATLMFEIVVTRILSVIGWYHFAFFVISLAMLGMTAGAMIVFARPAWFSAANVPVRLQQTALLFAITTPASMGLALCLPLTTVASFMDLLALTAMGVIFAVPFVASGITLTLALTRAGLPTGVVYAVDLVGAASGCALVIPLLGLFDAPSAALLCGAIAAVASAIFGSARRAPALGAVSLAVGLLGLAVVNARAEHAPLRPQWVKGRRDEASFWDYTAWNSYSRVTASHPYAAPPTFWGKGARTPSGVMAPVEQRTILIDGEAGTIMARGQTGPQAHAYLDWDVTSVAHALRPHGPAAVIGVGGGRDVLAAVRSGHRPVVGVELNGLIVGLHRGQMAEFSSLAALPGLELVADEARSYFSRDGRRYAVISMALVDTWAATGAGAYSLSENGLYTIEAWSGFLQRLQPAGVFSVSRGYHAPAPFETARMIALGKAAVWASGAARASDHVMVLQSENIATLLLGLAPYTPHDVKRIQHVALSRGFTVLVAPGVPPSDAWLRELVELPTEAAQRAWARKQPLDLQAPSDDRPFFFNMLRPSAWLERPPDTDPREPVTRGNLQATQTLLLASVTSLALALLGILAPVLRRLTSLRALAPSKVLAALVYFALIGFGFMCVQMGFLSRLSIFLGHPTLALAVLLAGMILFTGIGSLLSTRIEVANERWALRYPLIPALLVLSCWASSLPLMRLFQPAAAPARVLVSLALVSLPALGLGLCFPLGLRLVRRAEGIDADAPGELGPWLWGINGAFGVCGSSLGLVLSMTQGTHVTLMVGAACYLLLPFATRRINAA